MQICVNMLSIVVASCLFFTGLIHAAQPYYFIHTISNYRLLSAEASGLVGLYLPYFQIVLAFCICFRIAETISLCMAAVVFFVFAIAQATVLVRGVSIDCGCFGFVAHAVSPASLALPILLFCASTVAFLARRQVRLGRDLTS